MKQRAWSEQSRGGARYSAVSADLTCLGMGSPACNDVPHYVMLWHLLTPTSDTVTAIIGPKSQKSIIALFCVLAKAKQVKQIVCFFFKGDRIL